MRGALARRSFGRGAVERVGTGGRTIIAVAQEPDGHERGVAAVDHAPWRAGIDACDAPRRGGGLWSPWPADLAAGNVRPKRADARPQVESNIPRKAAAAIVAQTDSAPMAASSAGPSGDPQVRRRASQHMALRLYVPRHGRIGERALPQGGLVPGARARGPTGPSPRRTAAFRRTVAARTARRACTPSCTAPGRTLDAIVWLARRGRPACAASPPCPGVSARRTAGGMERTAAHSLLLIYGGSGSAKQLLSP